MKYSKIVPAIIPTDQLAVENLARELVFSRELHLDVVDGIFVPTVSWPYSPEGNPKTVKPSLDSYTLEVDLMVSKPVEAGRVWLEAGADMMVFHIETLSLEEFVDFSKTTKISLGVSCHGGTSINDLLLYAEQADYVQLMGIREIGSQGQPFDEMVLEKIAVVKKYFPDLLISVDGSVNKDTIACLWEAGADRLIVGSAIVKQLNKRQAYDELRTLINE